MSARGAPKRADVDQYRQENMRLSAERAYLLTALRETTDVLARIYCGESVAGRVLDAVDSARAAIARAEAKP